MDADFRKEQNSTLFCLVGALEGGFGGGWSLRGVHINHKVICMVRVVGLLFALEMAIWGVFLALDRPSPSNIDLLA